MALGWHGRSESWAQPGVRQHDMVLGLEPHQWLAPPVWALPWGRPAPPPRRSPLTQAQMEPLDKGRCDVPAARRYALIHPRLRAEHDVGLPRDEAPPSQGLAALGREELGPRQPARRAGRASWPGAEATAPRAQQGPQWQGDKAGSHRAKRAAHARVLTPAPCAAARLAPAPAGGQRLGHAAAIGSPARARSPPSGGTGRAARWPRRRSWHRLAPP